MCVTNNFNLSFMKRLPAFVLGNLLAMQAFAYDFQSGGLCYNITSGSQPLTVEVTYLSYDDNYPDLTKAEIPSSVTNDGKEYAVTAVGKNAFNYCSKLTSVSIPSSVKTIGVRAFFGCKGLSKVKFLTIGVLSITRQWSSSKMFKPIMSNTFNSFFTELSISFITVCFDFAISVLLFYTAKIRKIIQIRYFFAFLTKKMQNFFLKNVLSVVA